MDWLALALALLGAILAGAAGVVAYQDRSREDPAGSKLWTVPERSGLVATLTISSAGAVALSAAAGAIVLINR